jgi:hypothetical protein
MVRAAFMHKRTAQISYPSHTLGLSLRSRGNHDLQASIFDDRMNFSHVNDHFSVHHIINHILGHKIGNTDGMPDSTHIEEANPLLLESESDYRGSFEYSPDAVDFERNGDSENPLEWPNSSKWSIVALLTSMGFTMYVSSLARW